VEFEAKNWGENSNNDPFKRAKVEFEAKQWNDVPASETAVKQEDKPVEFEPNQWGDVGGLQDPEVVRMFEGLNELSPFGIKDGHATRTKNLTTSEYPALAVRMGVNAMQKVAGTDYVGGNVIGATTVSTEIQGIGLRGTELNMIAGGTWYADKGNYWKILKTGLDTTARWTFVNFQGNFSANNLLATNGVNAALKYDGTMVSNLLNCPLLSNFICTHDNRVYTAVSSTVNFSALRKAEDWTTVNDSGQIVVETTDGNTITGLVAGSSRLTVFKNNSIHELFGNSPSNFSMKIVTENLGSPTGNSAQVIDGVIYFLGNDARVYQYSGGSMPSGDFSLAVRETLGTVNKTFAYKSVSWQDGKKYYLAIPTGSNQKPDTILEFDTEFQTWNVWTMPNPITAKGIVKDGVTYLGSDNGTVYVNDKASATDNGTAVAFEWVSKPFGFSSLAARNRWFRIWAVADIPTGATLNIHVLTLEDGETWTQVQSITANNNATSAKEILIPTNLISASNWARIRLEGTGQVVIYELSRQARVLPFGQS
jgi:hypothetical protein